MHKILFIILILFLSLFADIIAMDSLGLCVILKEKYGGTFYDTCTVISLIDNKYYLTHKNSPTSIFSITEWTILKIKKIKEKESL
jgi:hypothetical protein